MHSQLADGQGQSRPTAGRRLVDGQVEGVGGLGAVEPFGQLLGIMLAVELYCHVVVHAVPSCRPAYRLCLNPARLSGPRLLRMLRRASLPGLPGKLVIQAPPAAWTA